MTYATIKYIVLVFLYMLRNNFQTNEHQIWGTNRTKPERERERARKRAVRKGEGEINWQKK